MIKHLEQLSKKYFTRVLPAGSIVLYQGEAPRSACLILEGAVSVYSISTLGDNQIITFHIAGEFFPSSWIFDTAPSTMFFYETLTECKISYCPKSDLVGYMLSDREKSQALLDYFTRNYSAFLVRVHALEQSKARDKLINTLYYLCQRYVKNLNLEKKVEIPIALTHQNLASMVGLTRETTAIEMSKLKKEKLINYAKQKNTVNVPRLFELMGEESFRHLAIAD